MAIVQILLAAIARSSGRILNTAVGWATTMIFGRVPEKRQIYVSVMTFGSLVWIALIVGIAFPRAGTFLLSFVPLPAWVDRKWVRLAMTIGAAVLPALVGAVSLLLRDPDERPTGPARLRAVLRGYPFTLGLAVTLSSLLAEQLAFGKAHLTWTKDAQALEDHMRSLHRSLAPQAAAGESGRRHTGALGPALDYVDSRLKEIDATYEEWEVLFRQKLLLLVAAGSKM